MVKGISALRLKTCPRRRERSTLISVLQTGHFNCRKPLADPSLKARILWHFSHLTATLGLLLFSVGIAKQLLSLVSHLPTADCFPTNRTAPFDRKEPPWKLEDSLPSHKSACNWYRSISCSTVSSFLPGRT